MYDSLDIARYVIDKMNELKFSISNLKLQKLLYYIQGLYIASYDGKKYLFDDDFEAWDYGPAIPKVYREFKYNGASSIINTKISFFKRENGKIKHIELPFDKNVIDKDDRDFIDKVLEIMGGFTANQLVARTHSESPWRNTYHGRKMNSNIISKELLFDYFKRYQNG